jgi:hypothetical protein
VQFRFEPLPRRTLCCALLIAFSLAVLAVRTEAAVSFENDVAAVLAKAGCNLGTCHGNATGKGGFKLSLRGDDPDFDFAALTRDQFGRRINVVEPDKSLLLIKALAQVAHEGGRRFEADSWEFNTLRAWIADGAPRRIANEPRLSKLEVSPAEKILTDPDSTIAIRATATFSDGSTRDVTRIACYETVNVGIAAVSADGNVTRKGFGETTVLVRFLNLQQPARVAFIPARPDFAWRGPAPRNFIDEHVFAKLLRLRINPSPACADEVFVRRVFLDLLGVLPTSAEARDFVANRDSAKRAKLVDQLLERPEFADFWALKWADLLRVETRSLDPKGVQTFHHWIRESIAANRPMDEFVVDIISARGSTYSNPAANFYRASRTPAVRGEAIAQLFLGVRLQCAQCHGHPFDRWTQDDYYDWAAVFAPIDYKIIENKPLDRLDKKEFRGEQIVFLNRAKKVTNPRTDKTAVARLLGESPDASGSVELESLARWLTRPKNPYFARALANRIWFHLAGTGIVDPIDDFRPTNPPSNPALLAALAAEFVKSGHDLRHLIRAITASHTYQSDSRPADARADGEANYAHAIVRRLSAEQLFDCLHEAAGVQADFKNYPVGIRAAELPGDRVEARRKKNPAAGTDQFLTLFGKPQRELVCECERSNDTSMAQTLQMISGPMINDLVSRSDNRLAAFTSAETPAAKIIDELYWTALTRPPTAVEIAEHTKRLEKSSDRRAALEDLLWSLLNAKEFVLRK